jgi:hypothetical protein
VENVISFGFTNFDFKSNLYRCYTPEEAAAAAAAAVARDAVASERRRLRGAAAGDASDDDDGKAAEGVRASSARPPPLPFFPFCILRTSTYETKQKLNLNRQAGS